MTGPTRFTAFRIFKENERIEGKLVQTSLDELTDGEIVLKTEYSGINYKDALAATGVGKILRRFPLIGGIDAAGTVISSTDQRYQVGSQVLVTGHDLGVSVDGGFSEYVRVPADWIVPVPDGFTTRDVMAIGTAGFTAALSIIQMERNGLRPENGPVIVTGSTGGVGSLAVHFLATLGYEVTALTGKDDAHEYLHTLGATHVILRGELEMGTRPLEKAQWAGAVDPVGGNILAWLTRTMKPGGCIASSGLTAGVELNTTVMPFILRGVNLLGIDSVLCSTDRRHEAWQRLATDMKPTQLETIIHEIPFRTLPELIGNLLKGSVKGRYVVAIG